MARHSVHKTSLWVATTFAAIAGLTSVSTTSTGCDGGEGGSGASDPCAASEINDQGCFNYDCFEDSGTARSFATDVLPLFERSCSLSNSCHGNPASPDPPGGFQPYLGAVDPETTPSDVGLIFDTVVGQDSHVATMKIIDPGKPESSFLMHKMDGDLDCADLGCEEDDCGDSMPQGSAALSREERDIVRQWILQGAENN